MMSTAPKSLSLAAGKFVYRSQTGADLMDVRAAMVTLKSALIRSDLTALDISCAEIVVAEILNNVVKHAQSGQKHGWFEVQCSPDPKGLHFVCRDNGSPMPGGSPPDRPLPSVKRSPSDLPEGGWGWSLVRTLTTNLSYMRIEGVNVISFQLPTNASASTA